jgi:AraC family transcriptional regulator
MSDFHIQPHFDSHLMRIEDFRCREGHLHTADDLALRHEIAFVRSGMFMRRDASGSVLADANHALFYHPNQACTIEHPAGGGDRCTVFVLEGMTLVDMLRAWFPAAVDAPDKPLPVSHTPVTPRQHRAHYQLLALAQTDPVAVEEAALLLIGDVLKSALAYAQRKHKPARPLTEKSRRELVAQVKHLLAANLAVPLRIDALAQAVSASAYWLCRIFRAETGISLHQYRLRLRLVQALDLLVEFPHASLTDVALRLGFYSHSHFTTAFSREFGLSPSDFRRQVSRSRLTQMSKILEA